MQKLGSLLATPNEKKKTTRLIFSDVVKKSGWLTVTAPTPKAKTSVSEVTVTATPAWRIVRPIRSDRGSDENGEEEEEEEDLSCADSRLFQHCTITNMSSIPMPAQRKNGD